MSFDIPLIYGNIAAQYREIYQAQIGDGAP